MKQNRLPSPVAWCGYFVRPGSRDSGSALIIVLGVTLGIVAVTLLFGDTTMLEYRAADNALAGLEAQQTIAGAERYLTWVFANVAVPGRVPDIEEYEAEEVAVDAAAFWLIGRGGNDRNGTPVFALTDESSKLNLNTATEEMLAALPGMTPEFAAAIIDWRDPDSEVTPGGAESETYLLRDPQYPCKDSPFESIDELRLVRGASWELLCGEDANRNGVLDPNENDGDLTPPQDNRNGELDCGILEYVTVYSREPNRQADGTDRRNVNEGRQGASYGSLLEFYIRSNMSPDAFLEEEDAITVRSEPFVEGLVNVNTAGAEVLAAIPGIGAEYAETLVAHREGRTDSLDSITWVLEVLDEESAVRAGPFITTRSYQYSADIAAVGHEGRGFHREFVVFDTSTGTARVIYRRDRTDLGWPLSAAIRETVRSSSAGRRVAR